MSRLKPLEAAREYPFFDDIQGYEPIGAGHIHQTYRLWTSDRSYLFQRINESVFPNVEQLIQNTAVVNAALARARAEGRYPLHVAEPILTRGGRSVARGEGGLWRVTTFLENSVAIDPLESAEQAELAGFAFGSFSAALADLDGSSLVELIPDFHDLSARLRQLEAAIREDPLQRAEAVVQDLDRCLEAWPFALAIGELAGELPTRVTHNDTKINNLLFRKSDRQPLAVVDLDTCMPGLLMHDFGDLVRSSVATVAEDADPAAGVEIREEVFSALARGYQRPIASVVTPEERESLWLGAPTLCLLVASRFLTDYLRGDRYFKIDFPEHNLVRARNQLALHAELVRQENRLRPLLLEQV